MVQIPKEGVPTAARRADSPAGQVLVPVLVARQTGLLDRGMYEAASGNVGLTPDDAPAAERDAA